MNTDPAGDLQAAIDGAANAQAALDRCTERRDIALARINAGDGTVRLSYEQIADRYGHLLAMPGRARMSRAGVQRAVERGRAALDRQAREAA